MEKIIIALLGLGTVGSQLLNYIEKNRELIRLRYHVQVILNPVFVRNLQKKRTVTFPLLTLTNDPQKSIRDADIVIDCLGGDCTELTRDLVLSSLQGRKSVILSSKKCLAFYGKEFIQVAKENNVTFYYDATVGGCIPISAVLAGMGRCEHITRIYGICNATSNFILEKMTQGIPYEEALASAKVCGLVENNPLEDVDGLDAVYKSVILAGFGMGEWEDPKTIIPSSIRNISPDSLKRALECDEVIKPIFSIEREGEKIIYQIGPKPVPKDSILAAVNKNHNVIVLDSNESGERAFIGQGAGARPTASAMFDDLVKILDTNYVQQEWKT